MSREPDPNIDWTPYYIVLLLLCVALFVWEAFEERSRPRQNRVPSKFGLHDDFTGHLDPSRSEISTSGIEEISEEVAAG